jgi:hypothetical protein
VVLTNPEEAIVGFDPDDSTQYLEGVDYPASKEDLASTAEGTGRQRSWWRGSVPWAVPLSRVRVRFWQS